MNYISTRGGGIPVTSAYAIKTGLAEDGGLFMPDNIPEIDLGFIEELSLLSYPERAAKILSLFLTDYTYDEATGVFSTTPGVITVPAATYTRGADGSFVITPSQSILVITGNI